MESWGKYNDIKTEFIRSWQNTNGFNWLVGFNGISNFVGRLTPNPFSCK